MSTPARRTTSFLRLWAEESLRRIRQDLWIYPAILVYTAAGLTLLHLTGNDDKSAHAIYLSQWTLAFLFTMPLLALACDLLVIITRFDRRRRLAYRRFFSPRRMAGLFSGLVLMMGVMVFQGTFTSIKNVLPALNGGFPYDRLHADIDAWLHLGQDPFRPLYAFGGFGTVRTVIEFNYNVLWFVVCFGALFFVATSPRADAIRGRYLALFMFTWIVCGNILAGLFLSAGPAFYGAVTGDAARFADQVAFLGGSHWPNSAAAYQRYLWSLYESGKAGFGGGISAFPSVHVGLITMNALFVAERSRRLGVAAFVYVLFVLMSSVYLGWHYAIDGYASMIVVLLGFGALRAFRRRSPAKALLPSFVPQAVPTA